MFKKIISICLVSVLLIASAVPMVMAAGEPALSLSQVVAPNIQNGSANVLCMNDNYMFVGYGTYIEVYSYDKDDSSVVPSYVTKIEYTSERTAGTTQYLKTMTVKAMTTVGNDYLLIAFCRPDAGNTYYAYPKLAICDVRSLTAGENVPCLTLIDLEAFTIGAYLHVEDNIVYLLEMGAGDAKASYLWSFDLDEALRVAIPYNWEIEKAKQDGLKSNNISGCIRQKVSDCTNADGGLVTSAYKDGNYLYFVQQKRLTVLDVSDRTDVIRKGITTIQGEYIYSRSVVASYGDYVFVGVNSASLDDNSGGIHVFNVSETKGRGTSDSIYQAEAEATLVAPEACGRLYYPWQGANGVCNGLMINGDYLYVSWPMSHRIAVYDVSDMANFNYIKENLLDKVVMELNLQSLLEDRHAQSKGIGESADGVVLFEQGGFHNMILKGGKLYFTDLSYGFRIADLSPAEKLENLLISKGNVSLENLEQGELTVSFDAANYSGDDADLCVIMALYYQGELEKIVLSSQTVPAGQAKEISSTIQVEQTEGYSLKVMVWDDLDKMNVKSVTWDADDATKALSTSIDLLPLDSAMTPASSAQIAASGLEVSEMDEKGVITVAGNISSGADKPVSILVENTSVNSETDRLSGVRFCSAAVSGEGGAYSFQFKPIDGGIYRIKVNGNNGVDELSETVNIPKASLSVVDNYDSPGDESYMQVNLEAGRVVDTLDFTLSYDHNTFLVENVDAINISELFTVVSAEITSPGTITCSLKRKAELTNSKVNVCTVDLMVKEDAQIQDYAIGLSATSKDRLQNSVDMNVSSGTYHIMEVSPKKQALADAITALQGVKEATLIDYANYTVEKATVTNAKNKMEAAVNLGVKESDFSQNLLDKLARAEDKLKEIEYGLNILSQIQSATTSNIDELIKTEKAFLGVTEEMLSIYTDIPDHTAVQEAVAGKTFISQTDVQGKLHEKMALSAIYQLKWTDMPNVFSVFNSVLNVNLNGPYAQLNDVAKANVCQALVKNNYATVAEVQNAFNLAVSQAASSSAPAGGYSGGGSSYSASAGLSVPNVGMNNSEIPADYQTIGTFTDLDSVTWAAEGINYLFSKGIVSGKANRVFAPNDLITREEFVKLLVMAFELEETSEAISFGDVNEDAWYYTYIKAACHAGVVSGYDDGIFGVGQTITREDMAVMVCRVVDYKGKTLEALNEQTAFIDAKEISDYALESVTRMQKAGIINGTGEGMFSPDLGATRAMAAKVVYELMQKIN
ncbi:MAG: S-layer homology domain-containing protein [Clostridia bacterium]|nr:S-layer homology domain-containing protein [Clostridia bacterium]